jgi:hypothetical protein
MFLREQDSLNYCKQERITVISDQITVGSVHITVISDRITVGSVHITVITVRITVGSVHLL